MVTFVVKTAIQWKHYLDIPELYDLYCDTEYDIETGSFLGMSDETKEEYRKIYRSFIQYLQVSLHFPTTYTVLAIYL